MREVTNITNEPSQRHIITLEDKEIIFNLRFYPTIAQWCFDIEYDSKNVKGVKLSLGVLHINNSNFPFDFVVEDLSVNGIDPFSVEDFSSGRCKIYILDPDNMEAFRGVPVAL